MEPDRSLIACEEPPSEPMDLLSSAWCSSAIQVLQTGPMDCSMALVENPVLAPDNDRRDLLPKNDRSLVVDSSGFSTTQWKYDDLKSWIWLQKAIHPELDYDLKKKWLPRKMAPWSGISLKKWVKERKQKRKEEARLHKAEVHAAVSVAGVAAALAAIAEENSTPAATMKETAVASAAALVAAQCAKVAEAAGATRDQVAAAVNAAVAATDASNVITLTAAAATSLRGAAALRGRRSGGGGSQNERMDQASSALSQDDLDFDFNYARSKAALAKGDEMFVAMPDGKWKLHTVSAATSKGGKVVMRIKKMNLVMAFSNAKESVIHDVQPCAPEKPSRDEDATYPIEITTSKGKVELRADDYGVYKRWVTALTHMLAAPTAICTAHELPPPHRRN
uniref:PH domain-containing protein n=1 Tax=Oryza punctata TaxID=4537 RepID=A0A0E0KSC7_ORYPU